MKGPPKPDVDVVETVQEAFKPIPVRRDLSKGSKLLHFFRSWIDLQVLTCDRFLGPRLTGLKGNVLDVGCGEMPYRTWLSSDVHYTGLDVRDSVAFGMRAHSDVVIFDGVNIPFADNSWDCVLCSEVLEHALEPERLVDEIWRVLRPGGMLLLTVPFSARVHHAPHDYQRFTRFRLRLILAKFTELEVLERGNDYSVIANKLVVLCARLLLSRNGLGSFVGMVFAIVIVAPVAVASLLLAHVSLFIGLGSKDDPLGYSCFARKP